MRTARHALMFTLSTASAGLVVNLLTGILTARILAPDGRGVLAAALIWASLVGYGSTLGMRAASSYVLARRDAGPDDSGTTLTAGAIGTLAGIAVVALAQLAVGPVFASQGQTTVATVRIFLWAALLIVWFEVITGVLSGLQLHRTAALLRLAQPISYCLVLLGLIVVDRFTVTSVLAVQAFSMLWPTVAGLLLVRSRVRVLRPSRDVAGRLLTYGRRVHVGSLASMSNSRLDLFLLPAVAPAAAVGNYSVAGNAANILQATVGNLGHSLLPIAAARDQQAQRALLVRALRISLAFSVAAGLALGLLAAPIVTLLYGEAFREAVVLLQILVPGVVAWSLAGILAGGLQAADLPGKASAAQGVGFVITAVGLAIALPLAGALGAAIVSSVAYVVTLLLMAVITPNALVRWAEVLDVRQLGGDVRSVLRRGARGASPSPTSLHT